jgi:hypothetical protein
MTWKDSLMRRDEVKAAFIEGVRFAMRSVEADDGFTPDIDGFQLEEAWRRSDARKALEKPLAD